MFFKIEWYSINYQAAFETDTRQRTTFRIRRDTLGQYSNKSSVVLYFTMHECAFDRCEFAWIVMNSLNLQLSEWVRCF